VKGRQVHIGLALLLAFVVCACGASARQKTIRVTYESIKIAGDALESYTKAHGEALIRDAKAAGKTKEQASAELEGFLAKVDHADIGVKAAYGMVSAAITLDDDHSLAALLKVAGLLMKELKDLGVPLP
jgi:hypothetical protein